MQKDHVANEANYLTYQGKYKGFLGWIFQPIINGSVYFIYILL
jgi:hypothetical protein